MTIAIATCAEFPALFEDDHPLLAGLAAAGIDAEPAVWNGDVGWDRFSGVLLRSVWDYHLHAEEFVAWLDLLDQLRIPCWNPTSLVRWNMDKRYLRDLEAKGIPTVPTLWLDREERLAPAEAAARILATGWSDVVVKPAVSAGAWRTLRMSRGELEENAHALGELLESDTILAQPFQPQIEGDGEWSLLFFDGAFSHAVVKRPRAGDFRVQWVHGGSHARATPSASLVSQARAVLEAAPAHGIYARVDGILHGDLLILMELEQIEPYLYFAEAPEAVDRFVSALRRSLRPLGGPAARGGGA